MLIDHPNNATAADHVLVEGSTLGDDPKEDSASATNHALVGGSTIDNDPNNTLVVNLLCAKARQMKGSVKSQEQPECP